jgi:DNA-binding LytR/AlgR family response regulator
METFGFSREDVISKKVRELNLWKDPTERDAFVARVKGGEEIRNEKVRMRAKNGQELDVAFSMLAINRANKPMLLSFGNPVTQEINSPRPASKRKNAKIALPTAEGLTFIKISDIVYLKASGNYTNIYMKQKQTLLVTRQLHEFEETLKDHNFFRIHNSTLVQMDYIEKYVRNDGGYVVMSNKASLNISRRRKDLFLKRVGYISKLPAIQSRVPNMK